ncbi:YmfQ family protein [Cohnella nanjingensis]|nr:YmfQ family protein [Cohnella nanjingensis]
MTYLPGFFRTSRIMSAIIDSQGAELDELRKALDETLSQYFVASATWGLDIWEQEFGISTDVSKPIDQRRSVVLSKMRGTGTVTVALIKRVAEAYANSELLVAEDFPEYLVTITFISAYGVPPNLADIQQAIRDVLPAHLDVNFVFRYYLYSQLKNKTYGQAKSKKYGEVYNGGLA